MVTVKAHSIPFAPPDPKVRAHFESIPWCAALYNDPSKKPILALTRIKNPIGANNLVSRTLATDDTIKAWQIFWDPPTTEYPRGQAIAIFSLAEGISGHPKTLHGGLTALLLDEMMNYKGAAYLTPGRAAFTMEAKTKYKKPVPLPGVVMVRAWVEERSQGRKMFMRGSVENGAGNVYAEGENLFIEVEAEPKAKL